MIIEKQKSLAQYTTFGVQIVADYYVSITSPDDIIELMNRDIWSHDRYILGGGSNILFVQDFKGLIIHNQIKGIEVINETEESLSISVGAGENWHGLVIWSVEKDLWGLENLVLIPGTVGASPVQNIGAYGVEAQDTITRVHVINLETGLSETLHHNQCNFSYRSSIFKQQPGKYFITRVEFKLSKIPRLNLEYGIISDTLLERGITLPNAQDMAETISLIRSSKLPAVGEIGMAGSFFKNPIIEKEQAIILHNSFPDMRQFDLPDGRVKISAGWLIDYLGYKGIQEGNVGTYSKHALVLVNYGGASGSEVWNFAQKIIKNVHDTFSIRLEPEVIIT